MEPVVINERDVEAVATPQGMTQFMVVNQDRRDGPNIMIRHWGPKTDLPVHSHKANEMFYVLDGELEIGGTLYGPGTCLFIPKDVPYGPIRVPHGEARLLRYYESEDPSPGELR